jgi:cAMP-dependent protein kinase regulator
VSSEEETGEDQDEVDMQIQLNKNKGAVKAQRSSVSAEVYGKFNIKETNFVARVIPKSDDTKKKLTERMMQSFLFNALEDKDFASVLNAMEEKRFSKGDTVIQQGENGDVLYLIYLGHLDCFKVFVS